MREKTIKVYSFSINDIEFLILKYLNEQPNISVCSNEVKTMLKPDNTIEIHVEKVD